MSTPHFNQLSSRPVAYRAELNRITGHPFGTLLLVQVVFWWDIKGRQPFFKFTAKPKTDHALYRAGDAWADELGFTRSQMLTAKSAIFTHIGTTGHEHGDAWQSLPSEYPEALVVTWRGSKQSGGTGSGHRLTWHMLNEPLLEARLADVYECYDPTEVYELLKSEIMLPDPTKGGEIRNSDPTSKSEITITDLTRGGEISQTDPHIQRKKTTGQEMSDHDQGSEMSGDLPTKGTGHDVVLGGDMAARQTWIAAKDQLVGEFTRATYDQHVRGMHFFAYRDRVFYLSVMNEGSQEWCTHRLKTVILAAIAAMSGDVGNKNGLDVVFLVEGEQAPTPPSSDDTAGKFEPAGDELEAQGVRYPDGYTELDY